MSMFHALVAALLIGHRPPVADLPFETIGSRIYLKAAVNGKPISAILDTGAATSVVDLQLAKDAGAETLQELAIGGAGAETQTGYLLRNFQVSLDGSNLNHKIQVGL